MSVTYEIKKIEKRLLKLERDMKRVKELLEMSTPLNPFEWRELNELDKKIISYLYEKKLATATEIATGIGLQNPERVGRVIVWKRMKRLVKLSQAKEGAPLLVKIGRKWALNSEDFTIALPVKRGEKEVETEWNL
jgi:hypothetical protein